MQCKVEFGWRSPRSWPSAIALRRFAQAKDIRIAHIYSRPARSKPTPSRLSRLHDGPGLRHRRHDDGRGRKIVVIEKDDQGKPDVGKSLLAAAYGDDKVDIAVGPTSSGVALAMLPVAEEYKKILLVEPAVADSITGDKWNKYIFRTGRNSSQDAVSNAVALDKPGDDDRHAGAGQCLRPRRREGLQGIIKNAKIVHEEYLPAGHHRLHGRPAAHRRQAQGPAGPKFIWVGWAGAANPFPRSPTWT